MHNFPSFQFQLFVSLYLKSITYSSNKLNLIIFILLDNLWPFLGRFHSFKFNVITDMVEFNSSILLFVFYLFYFFVTLFLTSFRLIE